VQEAAIQAMTPETLNQLVNAQAGFGELALLDAIPVAIYITDAEGRITYFNAAAVELSGRTPELGVDQWCVTWKMFTADGTPLPHDQCPMALALKGGKITEGIECLAERPDGTQFWFMSYPNVLRDSDGRITGGINLLVDITARKIAQAEMDRSARLHSSIVDSSDDAIISKSLDGTITSWNKSAERLFGYAAEEAIGKPVTMLMPPDRLEEEPKIIARLKQGERVDHFETIRCRKDGTLLDISLTISPVRDAKGTIVGASKIARDITDRRLAEAELRRVNQDLEQFAFSASHDLQEPLRNVKIYSELLTRRYRDKFDGEALEFLGYLSTGATRMETLVTDLLAYTQVAKIEEREITDANAVLASMLESLSSTVSDTHARITFHPLPSVPMHGAHLQQLFQNLIGNAIKYRSQDRDPIIHVSGERRGPEWIFSVADNGIGIAPEYKENVFGLFKRLHTSEEYSGTGIGLAICKRIVDQYHGHIWVESDPGEGSIFRFTITESRDTGR
jgi:PAS domain S-box-containing protein